MGLELMYHTTVAPMAQYLNVHLRKLGTIIIQTVHIFQHDSADTGSLPMGDFWHEIFFNPAGSSNVTPPYHWRRG
jgi:hypothetical protein